MKPLALLSALALVAACAGNPTAPSAQSATRANILSAPILREPAGFTSRAVIDPFYPRTVGWVLADDPIPLGFAEAFLDQEYREQLDYDARAAAS